MNESSVSPEFLEFQSAVAGRYSLDAEIGRGGMGIVYRAKDVTLDRVVAIKLLPPERARQTELHERFLREARTAARLSHPNIVPIFSVEESRGMVYFVMAYVDGETLTERVSRGGPLNPHEAVRIFREVAWALGYSHAQQLVHRDVKPDNIMLERGSGRALVMDFGIAGDGKDEFGGVIGTPHFMSPEQAAGEPLEATTDIYSFGATMFFALSGRPPFDGDDTPAVLAHHIRTTPTRLSVAAPGTPTRVSGIVERCLMKEPEERFARAEDLAEQLERCIEARKEVPVVVRAFVTRTRDESPGLIVFLLFYLTVLLLPGFIGFWGVPGGGAAWLGLLVIGAATPPVISAFRARKLLASGFDRVDLVRALEEEYKQRVEELPFIYGETNRRLVDQTRKFANVLLGGGLGVFAVGAIAQAAPLSILYVGMPLGVVSVLGGLLLRSVVRRRSAGKEWSRLKRWKGWFGRFVFTLGGWRLKKTSDAARLTYRPTEMAVGIAILGLFESLPRATRQTLGDLPEVVAGLENDAQRMRQRVSEFDRLLADSAGDTQPDPTFEDPVAGQRVRALSQLRAAREHAAIRLGDAVAALETLRVDLLRIRAGEVSLDSVTQNLGAARDVSEQVDRILEGQKEVSQLE